MRAIILLGHGSRVPDAGRDMESVAAALQARNGHELVEVCYMSQLGPHFPEAFAKCVARGAREVVVIPYFLHVGQHLRADIPRILQREAARHPDVKIILGRNLGFDPALVDLVDKRIGESLSLADVRTLAVPPDDAEHPAEHQH